MAESAHFEPPKNGVKDWIRLSHNRRLSICYARSFIVPFVIYLDLLNYFPLYRGLGCSKNNGMKAC